MAKGMCEKEVEMILRNRIMHRGAKQPEMIEGFLAKGMCEKEVKMVLTNRIMHRGAKQPEMIEGHN